MRISTDGFITLENRSYVRTPGASDGGTAPMPEEEAIAFLLSHAFRGARKIVRRMTDAERRQVHLAVWADSVNERMELLDGVWRSITEPVPVDERRSERALLQVVRYDDRWAYPLYFVDGVTRVHPRGGLAVADLNGQGKAEQIEIRPHAA